jgi:transposase
MTSQDLPSGDGPRADRPKRRTFTAAYKLRMVEEYDAAERGEKGALLRRERLYESSVQLWRRQRDSGELTASGPHRPATRKEKTP